MTLRDSAHKGNASLEMSTRLAQDALGPDPGGYRREFLELLEKARVR